jgi:sugar phosphate isomerase/epimerase
MRLGLLPTGLLARTVDVLETIRWAADHGYSVIDLPADRADAVGLAGQLGLTVGAITNALPQLVVSDADERVRRLEAALAAVRWAADHGVTRLMLPHARDLTVSPAENIELARQGWGPLAEAATEQGVWLCIEHWPNAGKNLAIAPELWRALFAAVPAPALGLCFDPSHLVWMGIDWRRALHEFGGRIHYAHAKDTLLDAEGQYAFGLYGRQLPGPGQRGTGWWRYTLPGFGVVPWGVYIGALLEVGYDFALTVEHEDDAWGWLTDLARTRQGLLVARDVLRPYLAVAANG